MPLDGKTASLTARDYLVTLHGSYNVWNFQVEKAEYEEKSKAWIIECSISPNMFTSERLVYEISISDDGNIKSANKKNRA